MLESNYGPKNINLEYILQLWKCSYNSASKFILNAPREPLVAAFKQVTNIVQLARHSENLAEELIKLFDSQQLAETFKTSDDIEDLAAVSKVIVTLVIGKLSTESLSSIYSKSKAVSILALANYSKNAVIIFSKKISDAVLESQLTNVDLGFIAFLAVSAEEAAIHVIKKLTTETVRAMYCRTDQETVIDLFKEDGLLTQAIYSKLSDQQARGVFKLLGKDRLSILLLRYLSFAKLLLEKLTCQEFTELGLLDSLKNAAHKNDEVLKAIFARFSSDQLNKGGYKAILIEEARQSDTALKLLLSVCASVKEFLNYNIPDITLHRTEQEMVDVIRAMPEFLVDYLYGSEDKLTKMVGGSLNACAYIIRKMSDNRLPLLAKHIRKLIRVYNGLACYISLPALPISISKLRIIYKGATRRDIYALADGTNEHTGGGDYIVNLFPSELIVKIFHIITKQDILLLVGKSCRFTCAFIEKLTPDVLVNLVLTREDFLLLAKKYSAVAQQLVKQLPEWYLTQVYFRFSHVYHLSQVSVAVTHLLLSNRSQAFWYKNFAMATPMRINNLVKYEDTSSYNYLVSNFIDKLIESLPFDLLNNIYKNALPFDIITLAKLSSVGLYHLYERLTPNTFSAIFENGSLGELKQLVREHCGVSLILLRKLNEKILSSMIKNVGDLYELMTADPHFCSIDNNIRFLQTMQAKVNWMKEWPTDEKLLMPYLSVLEIGMKKTGISRYGFFKSHTDTQKTFPTLKEITAQYVISKKIKITPGQLPEDIVNYLQTFSCFFADLKFTEILHKPEGTAEKSTQGLMRLERK